jgi:hypothetical protein
MNRFEGCNWKSLEQDLPLFRLGRVVDRVNSSVPEVSGLTALFNASPVGDWTVKSVPLYADGGPSPKDFQIDLYLSVLTA